MSVSEIERQQNHICEIDPNHLLKQVALDCLRDKDAERPLAEQLCERVGVLKEDSRYNESLRVVEARGSTEQQYSQQVQDFQQIQASCLAEKDQIIAQKDETIAELRQQTQQLEREKERELRQKEGVID